ncbi:ATP-binding cassette domain-containing protein [Pinibacter aurantiacus]|uniref:ABC transporter ATP-binding protein/permease n=1 Tax=Pinibacter aurantiacus TaxID=2851599 RepID=A0A9E2SCM7_9BACT|nr:ABC transporter ATP-binding protein [Pinibacter aurantiacus]MBV4360161.1 ABC transporter ATP-binding protein/permease [Pinibacter aurantiacus]
MKLIIKHIFKALTPEERKQLWSMIFPDILLTLLDVAFMAALVWLTAMYAGTKNASVEAVSNFFGKDSLWPIAIFLMLFIAKNIFAGVVLTNQFQFIYKVALRISRNNLISYFHSDYAEHVQTAPAIYVRKISQEPIEFCYYVLRSFQQMVAQIILIFITITAVLLYSPVIFLLLLIVLLPPVIMCSSLMKRKVDNVKKVVKKNSEQSLQYLHEALAAFVESNVYNAQSFFTERYVNHQQLMNEGLASQQSIQALPSRFIEAFAVAGLFILVVINKTLSGTVHLEVVTLGAFIAAAYKIIPGAVKILNSIGQIKAYEFTIHPLAPQQKAETNDNADTNIDKGIQHVAFENVSFAYRPSTPVLSYFNLSLHRGDIVGIHGLSGKGKTTVVNLLLGFLSPSSGAININGVNTTTEDRKKITHLIAYVKQHPFLFNDSVWNNITLGKEEGENTEVETVLQATSMQQIVSSGFDAQQTHIADAGRDLSGGQRQRITIARALYKNADLIILDEPFKELDEASEIKLLNYFQELASQGKIIILITHNKSSLHWCNKMVEIDE